MSKPKFYYKFESPPCRFVMYIAKMLNIEMEMIDVNIFTGDHLTPEYKKLNPFNQIPAFVDTDGFVLTESRVIATYLIQSRKLQTDLYPIDDLKQRTQIDRWLQFDCSSLFMSFKACARGYFRYGGVKPEAVDQASECMTNLDKVMATNTPFLTGDKLTVADISIYCTIALPYVMPDFDMTKYPNIVAWYQRVEKALEPYDQEKWQENSIKNIETVLKAKAAGQ